MSTNIQKKAIEEALRPARSIGHASAKPLKKELIEKITPISPGGASSLGRKLLKKALGE